MDEVKLLNARSPLHKNTLVGAKLGVFFAFCRKSFVSPRLFYARGAKRPLQPVECPLVCLSPFFHVFSCESSRGYRGTAKPSPCINNYPPWLDGFTKVKTACPRRKKQNMFNKKHCLDFNAIINQKSIHFGE